MDEAMEGLRTFFTEDRDPDGTVLEMVIAGLARAGRLRDASETLLEAINAGWIGVVPLEKTTAILGGLSMKCAKEDDYAREFVEVRFHFFLFMDTMMKAHPCIDTLYLFIDDSIKLVL